MNTAAYIHGQYDMRIGDYAPPAPGDDEVRVRIAAVGVCGSDLHYYKDGGIGGAVIREPFIPGHEFSAWLEDDVESLGLRRGDLVAIDPATPCHACEWCHRGHHNLCPKVKFLGSPPYQGALTQELTVSRHSLVKLPDGIDAETAAMLEPLGVCIHAVDLASPALIESIAIVGCGPIGIGILQLLKRASCSRIIAIDPQAHRRELALQEGARDAGDRVDCIADLTAGRGCDLVIEATNSPDGFRDAVTACAIGGRLVLVGIPDGDLYSPLSAAEARRRGLTIRFSRRMGEVYGRAIRLVSEGHVDVSPLITHRFDLEETPSAYERQANQEPGLVKSMVYPNGVPNLPRG